MANLPTIDDFGVRPTPRAGRKANITAVGDTSFQSVSDGVSAFSQALEKVRAYDDKIKAEDAYTKINGFKLDLSVGEKGFSKALGENAIGGDFYKNYSEQFEAKVDEISNGLTNDSQRRMFESRAAIARQQFGVDLANHVEAQRKVYINQVVENGIEIEMQSAKSNAGNDNAIGSSLGRINYLIDQKASAEGWSGSAKRVAKTKAASDVHRSVISQFLANDNDISASEYYKKNAKQIEVDYYDDIEKALNETSVKNRALDIAHEINDLGLSDTEARQMMNDRTKGNAKLYGVAKNLLNDLIAENKASMEAERTEQFNSAIAVADINGSISGIPEDTMLSFTQSQRDAIKQAAINKREGKFESDNKPILYKAWRKIADNPTEFQNDNLEEIRPYLSTKSYENLLMIQNNMRSKTVEATRMVKSIQAPLKMVDQAFMDYDIDPSPKKLNQTLEQAKFDIYEDIDEWRAANPDKPLTRKIVSDIVSPYIKDNRSSWFGADYKVVERTDERVFASSLEQISQSEIDEISAALTRGGIDVTDRNIIEIYNKDRLNFYESQGR